MRIQILALLAASALWATPAQADELGPGDKAPAFALVGSDKKTHVLEEFLGKRGIVLAWFPKAFTPG